MNKLKCILEDLIELNINQGDIWKIIDLKEILVSIINKVKEDKSELIN
jgi:hypothetical protein